MREPRTVTIAHAIAHILELSTMARSEVIQLIQRGAGMTDGQANEVIAYGLAHSLLVEDPADSARLQGTPRPRGVS